MDVSEELGGDFRGGEGDPQVKYLGGDGDPSDAVHRVFWCFCRVQIAEQLILLGLLEGLAFGVFDGAVFGSDVEVADDDGLAGLGLGADAGAGSGCRGVRGGGGRG